MIPIRNSSVLSAIKRSGYRMHTAEVGTRHSTLLCFNLDHSMHWICLSAARQPLYLFNRRVHCSFISAFFIDAAAASATVAATASQMQNKKPEEELKKRENKIDWISHRSALFDADIAYRLRRFYWMRTQYAIKRNEKNCHSAVHIVWGGRLQTHANPDPINVNIVRNGGVDGR